MPRYTNSRRTQTKRRKKRIPQRKTQHLFDLIIKFILQEASPVALIHLINGLFGKRFSVDTPVTFKTTEQVSSREGKLAAIRSDFSLEVGNDGFLLEVQIRQDRALALRLLDYGYAHARRRRRLSKDGSQMTLILPEQAVIYLEPTRSTPEQIRSRIETQAGDHLDYIVKTYPVLEQDFEEVEERNVHLLLPLYLIVYRRAVKKAGTNGEQQAVAGKTAELIHRIEGMVKRGYERGVLSERDVIMVLERVEQMYTELYGMYEAFQEEQMKLEERLRTKWQEYLKQGEQKGEERIIGLLEQGYTLQQIKELVAQEANQSKPSTVSIQA
jgi:hypothetical protein